MRKTLESETRQKEKLEEEIAILQNQLLQLSFEADKVCRPCNPLLNDLVKCLQVYLTNWQICVFDHVIVPCILRSEFPMTNHSHLSLPLFISGGR